MSFRKSFNFARRGLIQIWKREINFRRQVWGSVVLLVFLFFIQVDFLDLAIIILSQGLVLLAEGVNSVVEALCDAINPRLDERIGLIKDMSAGVVLVASFVALLVIIFTIYPYLFEWLAKI